LNILYENLVYCVHYLRLLSLSPNRHKTQCDRFVHKFVFVVYTTKLLVVDIQPPFRV